MTSKISFFKLMKEDIRHRIWLVALSCFGSIMTLPVLFLFSAAYLTNNTPSPMTPFYVNQVILNYLEKHCINFQGTMLIIGAVLVAVFGYRHLFSKKMVDLYHSAPVKRSRLFLVYYVDGILIWLIPYLIGMLLTLVLCFIYLPVPSFWSGYIVIACKLTLHFLFSFLCVYHVSLVAVMISGNMISAFVNLLLLGTLAAAVSMLIGQFFVSFMDTFVRLSWDMEHILWLSPLAAGVYAQFERTPYYLRDGSDIFFLISSLLMSAAAFAAAMRLYCKRPSELAGQGLRENGLAAVLRMAAAYLFSLLPVAVIIIILNYGSSSYWGWCIFGSIIGCVLGHGILNTIYSMNFRNFLAHKAQLGTAALLGILTIMTFYFDWLGYDTRIPSPETMESVSVDISSFKDDAQNLIYTDGQLLDKRGITTDSEMGYIDARLANKLLSSVDSLDTSMNYTDTRQVYELLSSVISKQDTPGDSKPYTWMNLNIKLKSGGMFYRQYKIYPEEMELLRPIIESDEYKNTQYSLYSGGLGHPYKVEMVSADGRQTFHVKKTEEIAAIMDAYYSDFNHNYSMDHLKEYFTCARITVTYTVQNGSDHRFTLDVPEYYKDTLAALKSVSPDIILQESALDIAQIEITPDINPQSENLQEELYRFFGYDTVQPDSEEEIFYSADSMERSQYVGLVYSITDSSLIEEIMKSARVALDYRTTVFSENYICPGTLVTSEGTRYSLYLIPGTFPKDHINAILDQIQ